MMRSLKSSKRILTFVAVTLGLLVGEFVFLEGTIGISLPSDRRSALSSLEIVSRRTGVHFVTHNVRFTVVDLVTEHGSRMDSLVLREAFFMDREEDAEGPPDATVTVTGMVGEKVRWTLQEPGQVGDAVTDNLYRVIKFGHGEIPNAYTYFSLADGRKVRSNNVELSRDELTALDGSIVK